MFCDFYPKTFVLLKSTTFVSTQIFIVPTRIRKEFRYFAGYDVFLAELRTFVETRQIIRAKRIRHAIFAIRTRGNIRISDER